jgi:hypothetical protein
VRETAAPSYAPRALSLHDTLHSLGWSALAAGSTAGAWELRHVSSVAGAATIGSAVAGAALVASLPRLFRAARLAWRNGSVERSLAQVGRAVLEALGEAGLANADEVADGAFVVRHSLDGRADIVLTGVRRATERHVMQAIAEVLGPVQNPRYLLVRSSRLGPLRRTDYHAVPAALGARKEWAEAFATRWNCRVGAGKLVFTRRAEGRILLLRARARSFAAGFQRSVNRRSAWL